MFVGNIKVYTFISGLLEDVNDDEAEGETMLDLIQKEQEGQNDPHEVTKKVVPDDDVNDDNPMQLKMREIMSNPGMLRYFSTKQHKKYISLFHLFLASQAALKELQSHTNFKSFVKKFKRSYKSGGEYKRRYTIFRENMKKIQFLRETELGTGR